MITSRLRNWKFYKASSEARAFPIGRQVCLERKAAVRVPGISWNHSAHLVKSRVTGAAVHQGRDLAGHCWGLARVSSGLEAVPLGWDGPVRCRCEEVCGGHAVRPVLLREGWPLSGEAWAGCWHAISS